eukprot:3763574-Pyramimonas_sp.AAC.1
MLRLGLRPVRLRRQDTSILVRSIWRPSLVSSGDVFFHHHGQRSAQGNFVIGIIKIFLNGV